MTIIREMSGDNGDQKEGKRTIGREQCWSTLYVGMKVARGNSLKAVKNKGERDGKPLFLKRTFIFVQMRRLSVRYSSYFSFFSGKRINFPLLHNQVLVLLLGPWFQEVERTQFWLEIANNGSCGKHRTGSYEETHNFLTISHSDWTKIRTKWEEPSKNTDAIEFLGS
jgi:hypothetical protein